MLYTLQHTFFCIYLFFFFRQEYVDLYVDFILNKSIAKHFDAFNKGFHKVCGGRVLRLFQSHELMDLVVG
jgi:E3 ubiquitin-protein ligase HERC4